MKGIIDFLSAEDTGKYLLKQQDFSSRYLLTVHSCFQMGKDNSPIHVSAATTIDLKQVVDRKRITTRISVSEISLDADQDNIKEALQEIQILSKTNPIWKSATLLKRNSETLLPHS